MTLNEAKKIFGNIDDFSNKESIKKRYRKLAKRYHTDANGDIQKMIQLNQAKDIIDAYCDHLKRNKRNEKRDEKVFNRIQYYKNRIKNIEQEICKTSNAMFDLKKEIKALKKEDWYLYMAPTEKLAMKAYHHLFDNSSFIQKILKHIAIFLTISFVFTILFFQNLNLNNAFVLFFLTIYPMLMSLLKASTHDFAKQQMLITKKTIQFQKLKEKYDELLDEKQNIEYYVNILKNHYKKSA